MLAPSPLLSDSGFGPDYVTYYQMVTTADADGNAIRRPVPPGMQCMAIVESGPGAMTLANGTQESVTVYSILLYTDEDPGIRNGDNVVYRGDTLVAQGDASRAAGGAWSLSAMGVGPVKTAIPYGF
jgi:hypothetical protein